ncbi:MAG: hypothetical protein U0M59_03480 [Angelakisella sp.]
MKKMSKILTFILVLAMVLSTVAMAAEPPYTVSAPADSLTHGKITITYDTPDTEKGGTKTVNGFLNSTTTSIKLPNDVKKIKVSFTANPGYEFVSATYKVGDTDAKPVADFGEIEITGNTAITPVFQAKSTLGGEKTADSFRLDAICSGSYYWQMYHKDMANNKKYTKYPGSPADKVNPSSEIVKGNYVDLTLYVTDNDFLSLYGSTGYSKNNFSVTTPGDSSFLAGSGAGAEIEKWTVGSTDKGMVIQLTGVYYVGGSDNTLKLIITQGNYNAIVTCKIDNATIVPEKENDKKPDEETTAAQPYVIISSYSYGKGDLVAGETRNITMTFRNTSKTMAVENMMVTMTLPDAMMLTSSSNSFYIESLAAEGTITKTVNVTVKPTAAAQSHSMTVDFTYDYLDNGVRRNAKTTETISMPVLQVDRFTVTGIDLSQEIFMGEENNLSVNFVNKSRTEIYNLSAKLNCEGLSNNGEEQYLGNLASGTASSADFYITGNEKGELVGEVIITYEDTNMNQRTVSVPFTTKVTSYEDVWGPQGPVSPQNPDDPGMDPGMEQPAGFPWFWVIGGVVVVAAGVFVYLKLRKNKKESVEEDEDI